MLSELDRGKRSDQAICTRADGQRAVAIEGE